MIVYSDDDECEENEHEHNDNNSNHEDLYGYEPAPGNSWDMDVQHGLDEPLSPNDEVHGGHDGEDHAQASDDEDEDTLEQELWSKYEPLRRKGALQRGHCPLPFFFCSILFSYLERLEGEDEFVSRPCHRLQILMLH